jgi:hypothetical protein
MLLPLVSITILQTAQEYVSKIARILSGFDGASTVPEWRFPKFRILAISWSAEPA